MLQLIDAERLRVLTPWPKLIDALETAFRKPCETPERLHGLRDALNEVIAPAPVAVAAK